MKALARWCIAHRRTVVIAWVVVLIGANVAGAGAGSVYNSNFKGQSTSGSQRALDLLAKYSRPARATRPRSCSSRQHRSPPPACARRSTGSSRGSATTLTSAPSCSDVGPHQIAPDGHIAYATVLFDERSFQLPKSAIDRVINTAESARSSGLDIQLGGQPIEQVEPPSTGPATGVGSSLRSSSC